MSAPQESVAPAAGTGNGVYCNYCGATPAAATSIRGHRGFVIFMQFVRSPGPFCHDCGLATYRRMTVASLWLGWWGLLSMVINPITMLINLGARSAISALPAPIPGSPRQPMDPGKPLRKRPEFLVPAVAVAIAPISIVVAVVLAAQHTKDTPAYGTNFPVGSCVKSQGHRELTNSSAGLDVVPCSDSTAQAKVISRIDGNGQFSCSSDTYRTEYADNRGYTLCLQRVNH